MAIKGSAATIKTCTKCGETGGKDIFYLLKNGWLMQPCKECVLSNPKAREVQRKWQNNNKDKVREATKRWRINNPDKVRDATLKKTYKGMSLQQWNEMVLSQNGLCKICKQIPTGTRKNENILHVDHDHKTGQIRGLLCHKCNHLLGNSRDDISILKNAIKYLEEN